MCLNFLPSLVLLVLFILLVNFCISLFYAEKIPAVQILFLTLFYATLLYFCAFVLFPSLLLLALFASTKSIVYVPFTKKNFLKQS